MLELNEEQLEAVNENGHCIVVAGPGCGKTATLVARAVKILSDDPDAKILMLTFTKKAASEMEQRILTELSGKNLSSKSLFVGTIHAWAYGYLQKYDLSMPIISQAQQKKLVQKIISRNLKSKNVSWQNLLLRISILKQKRAVEESSAMITQNQEILEICEIYDKELKEQNLFDFEDILIKCREGLTGNRALTNEYKYTHILVDEFQDLDLVQFDIVRHLQRGAKAILFTVGDSKQGIYGFRGANNNLFEKLLRHLGRGCKLIKLKYTYRCPQLISDLSASLFSPNEKLQSYASKYGQVFHIFTESDYTEAAWITNNIKMQLGLNEQTTVSNYINSTISLKDVVVLVRSYQTASLIAKEFDSSTLPYLLMNDLHWSAFPKLAKIFNFLSRLNSNNTNYEFDEFYKFEKKDDFSTLVFELTENITMSQLWEKVKTKALVSFDYKARAWQLQIEALVRQYANMPYKIALNEFLVQWQLLTINDQSNDNEKINIMSIHSAKGLEFNSVYIAGFDEGLLPLKRNNSNINSEEIEIDNEEERRLLYVALTRSSEKVFLTSAKWRKIYGKRVKMEPSSFIQKMDESLITHVTNDDFLKSYAKRISKLKIKKMQGKLF